MDCIVELFQWPTLLWTGMISAVMITLFALTIWDNKPCPAWVQKVVDYFNLQHNPKKDGKS